MNLRRFVFVLAVVVLAACGGAPATVAPTEAPEPVILATAITRPTATPEPEPTAIPPTATPATTEFYIETTGAVYTGPGTNFPKGKVIYGPVKVTAFAVRKEHGDYWYHIRSGDVEGWVTRAGLNPSIIASLPVDTETITPGPTDVPTATSTPRPTKTPEPEPTAPPAAPATGGRVGAICRDGSRSSATGRGACSHHGGVAQWVYK